jgi:hypothetical protein
MSNSMNIYMTGMTKTSIFHVEITNVSYQNQIRHFGGIKRLESGGKSKALFRTNLVSAIMKTSQMVILNLLEPKLHTEQ